MSLKYSVSNRIAKMKEIVNRSVIGNGSTISEFSKDVLRCIPLP
jgi:hypothetical protein